MTYPQALFALLPSAIGRPRYVSALDALPVVRARLAVGDPEVVPALTALVTEAEDALTVGPFSVTGKRRLPVSGDPHDYYSIGPYWWPNPATADGLPYVRRDGEVNPEFLQTDRTPLEAMVTAVTTLCRAYAFTGRRDCAARAVLLLRVWFLDEATRMTPHLDYGQAIPGHCMGRGIGIIDTLGLATQLLPALGLLEDCAAWPEQERAALQRWFHAYLAWLLTSPHGIDEGTYFNNHGVAYDLQCAVFALFLGAEALARQLLAGVPARRIAAQIEPDGRQLHELARTKSLSYASMNLSLFLGLTAAGRTVGLDLAAYASPDGRSIRRALDWLLPFYLGAPWPHQQISPYAFEAAYPLLRQAARLFDDPSYADQAETMPMLSATAKQQSPARLLYPLAP
jgi:hypothetical protein